MLGEIVRRLSGGPRLRVEVLGEEKTCMVRSVGLKEAGLPEVQIADCPLNLADVASNLVLQIARNGSKTPESLAEGKVIGARFANPRQQLLEAFRFVRIDAECLRIVDLNSERIFPSHLLATHLCATASASSSDQLRLLLVAIELWPKESESSNASLGDYELNPNNFWSWIDLGTTLSRMAPLHEAISHWKTAVCMWPRGGKLYASRMLADRSAGTAGSVRDRTVHEFWRSVTNDAIRTWCAGLDVKLPESALAD